MTFIKKIIYFTFLWVCFPAWCAREGDNFDLQQGPPCKKQCVKACYDGAVIAKIREYYDKGQACPVSELKPLVSQPVIEAIMSLVFRHKLNVVFSENMKELTLLDSPRVAVHVQRRVHFALADLMYDYPGKALNKGELACLIYKEGYDFKSFFEFTTVFYAVKALCYCEQENGLITINNFAGFLRRGNWCGIPSIYVMRDDFQAQAGEVLHDYMVSAAESITSLSALEISTLQRRRLLMQKRGKHCDFFENSGRKRHATVRRYLDEILRKHLTCGTFCKYDDLEKKNYGWAAVFRAVLDFVFERKITLKCKWVEREFLLLDDQEWHPRNYIPVEVVIAMRFSSGWFCVEECLIFAQRLFSAGYDFDSYEDFEILFFSVCLLCRINSMAKGALYSHQNFWRYVVRNKQGKTFEELCTEYKESQKNLLKESVHCVQKAFELERTGILEQWGIPYYYKFSLNAVKRRDKAECIVLTLQEHAKNQDVCSYKELAIYTDSCDPEIIFAEIMGMVLNGSFDITYDRQYHTYGLRHGRPPRTHSQLLPLVVHACSEYVHPSDIAYCLYAEGVILPDLGTCEDLQKTCNFIKNCSAEEFEQCRSFVDDFARMARKKRNISFFLKRKGLYSEKNERFFMCLQDLQISNVLKQSDITEIRKIFVDKEQAFFADVGSLLEGVGSRLMGQTQEVLGFNATQKQIKDFLVN